MSYIFTLQATGSWAERESKASRSLARERETSYQLSMLHSSDKLFCRAVPVRPNLGEGYCKVTERQAGRHTPPRYLLLAWREFMAAVT